MERNQRIQEYPSKLSATPETNYSLWKATKRLKRPQTHHSSIKKQNRSWTRSEEEGIETFIRHLSRAFKLTHGKLHYRRKIYSSDHFHHLDT